MNAATPKLSSGRIRRDVSPTTRSRIMAAIHGTDTGPEMAVRRFLHGQGYRYGLHRKDLPGRPDLVLPKWNAVVFVHGCFWHFHEHCKLSNLPTGNRAFWRKKLLANRKRDRKAVEALRKGGWRVGVVWDCALTFRREAALRQLASWLPGNRRLLELRA